MRRGRRPSPGRSLRRVLPLAGVLFAAALAAPALVAAAPAAPAVPDCWLGVVLPSRTVELTAEVGGRVLSVDVRPGDQVAAGRVLAVLDTADVRRRLDAERAALAAARLDQRRLELELARAEQEQGRLSRLDGLVAQRDLDAAAFRVEDTRARVELAAAERERVEAGVGRLDDELGRSEVRAPFAGTVALRHVDPGAVVQPGAPVVRLLGGEEPFVRFAVPPERAGALAPGDRVRVELDGGAGGGTPTLGATIRQVSPEVDAAAAMVFVEARLEAPAAAAPGGAARVSIAGPVGAPGCFDRAAAGAGRTRRP